MRHPNLAAIVAGAALGLAPVPLAAQEDPEPPACRILGRVIDGDSEAPIAGASVWLERGDGPSFLAGTSTGENGAFELAVPRCLDGVLRVRMIGYAEATEPVDLDADSGDRMVRIRLERAPLELEELQVEVPRSDRLVDVGFYARKEWEASTGRDYGAFYDPEELHTRGEYLSLSGIVGWSRIRFVYGGCSPSWYLDGRRILERDSLFLSTIKPEELEGMEIYRAVWGAIPEGYRDPNSNSCGAVLLWTKGPPQIEVELCAPSGSSAEIRVEGRVLDADTDVPLPATSGFGPRIRLDLEVPAAAADSASGADSVSGASPPDGPVR